MTECTFCKVALKQIAVQIVAEDDLAMGFMDVSPIRPGHVQIIPRKHFAAFDDLPPDVAADIVQMAQRLARVMKQMFGVQKVGFMFTGGTGVAHAHAHVVPMHAPTDITSRLYIAERTVTFRNMPRARDDELAKLAVKLRLALGG